MRLQYRALMPSLGYMAELGRVGVTVQNFVCDAPLVVRGSVVHCI